LEFPITKYFGKAGKYEKERDVERKGEKGRERDQICSQGLKFKKRTFI
jgi:hypothetical protein